MDSLFWVGIVLFVGGILLFFVATLANPWLWVIVGVVGLLIALYSYFSSRKTGNKSGK